MKTLLLPSLLALALLVGCASLNPGADAFVVRVEQTQTAANATFDFVLHMDQANRPFWQTNAPAFHNFCEWLRTPQPYGASPAIPRSVVMQLNVDDLKLAYTASKSAGTSNALFQALSVLSSAIAQSTSWSNIVVTPTHP